MLPVLAGLALAEPTCLGTSGDAAGWGCRSALDGYTVLQLHGTDAQVGRLYAELLHDEMVDRYLPMMDGMLADLPGAFRAILRGYARQYPGFFDTSAEARVRAVEEAVGRRAGTMREYAWVTELSSIGPALLLGLGGTVQWDGVSRAISTGRCTSVVAPGIEGGTIHARNFDYWGMGYWQPNATLVFVDPRGEDGAPDGIRYAALGSVGEVFPGSTAVNERGVVLTTHLNASRDVAIAGGRMRFSVSSLLVGALSRRPREGVSVYVLAERVMRRAGSVDDAVGILGADRPVGAWTLVVSDPTGAHAAVGANARDTRATRDEPVVTNFYFDADMRARELVPVRGPVEGARLRYQRARELLAEHGGALGVDDAIGMLRDRFDLATATERPVSPNSIASPDSSQSAVVWTRPDAGTVLWIASPHADAVTPSPYAPWFAVRFEDGFGDAPITAFDHRDYEPEPWLGDVTTPYTEAMADLLDRRDPVAALRRLRLLPTDDPGVALMAAWLAASQGDRAGAHVDLARALTGDARLSPHHRILARFLAGELARAEGDRLRALTAYREALELVEADHSASADLNAMLATVLRARIATGARGRPSFPVPDLKYQDVLELRVR